MRKDLEMGYRTTIVSQDYYLMRQIPKWFKDKYEDEFNISGSGVISSKSERKFYSREDDELFQDFSKVIAEAEKLEDGRTGIEVTFALLHEDGAIDRVIVSADKVVFDDDEYIGFSQLRW